MSEFSVLEVVRTLADFPTLERFASVLWKQDNSYHGAAIMVGAGFSRCSSQTGDRSNKLPLWTDFSTKLQQELKTQGGIDPLRIAEEYTAYFGRQALNDLIKKEINDASWEPGDLHRSLLNLPWTEVLTTNWDTLLERASEEIHEIFYSVVHHQEDLSYACSPRIVKLHGTLNVTSELTFTQEDYRTYPVRHAPFVNFARQVFIENELCLVGFSGDDPNFLQWAGWVRDHLSTSARRIYLVGALELNAAKRKYLESINIAPIDLAMLVTEYDDPDLKHKKATELFLNTLHELRPKPSWEWSPSLSLGEKPFQTQLREMKKEREEYPGWIICPYSHRFFMHSRLDYKIINKKFITSLELDSRAALLYEVAWCYNTSFQIAPEWLAREMLAISDPSKPNSLSKHQQLEIAAYILKVTRWYDGEGRSLKQDAKCIIQENKKFWSDCEDILAIHEANEAKFNLDYSKLEQLLPKINAASPDSKIQKAALCGELGLFDEGESLLSDARRYLLEKYRGEKHSVYLLSRLSFANSLLVIMDRDHKYTDTKFLGEVARVRNCDLWQHIDGIKDQVRKAVANQEKNTGIEVLFEPGTYRDNSSKKTYSNEVHPFVVFEEITSQIGIPVRWENTNILIDVAASLLRLDELTFHHRLYLTLQAATSEKDSVLEKTFSRIQLARIPHAECEVLIDWCIEAVLFWVRKASDKSGADYITVLTKLRVLVEILARLSVRAQTHKAKELFLLALNWGHESIFRHPSLRDPFGHLLKYTLKSIPNFAQNELLFDALKFPLLSEVDPSNSGASFDWPNPIIRGNLTRSENAELDHRVDQIIDLVSLNEEVSRFALERLLPLLECDYLKDKEKEKLCKRIWGDGEFVKELPNTGLLHWVTLKLPCNRPVDLIKIFKSYVYDAKRLSVFDAGHLLDLINCRNVGVTPTAEEALGCFKVLVNWAPPEGGSRETLFFDEGNAFVDQYVSEALGCCIVPALDESELNERNYKKVKALIGKSKHCKALISLPYFTHNAPSLEGELEKLLREYIHSSDSAKVSGAALAVLEWRKRYRCESTDNLIATLITMVTLNRESSAVSVLWSINELLRSNYLSETQINLLNEVIPTVYDNSNYNVEHRTESEQANASLFRAAVVKLVKSLNDFKNNAELERVLSEARFDPLPEVRFALEIVELR